jgi:SAM-dependent methyltransferase
MTHQNWYQTFFTGLALDFWRGAFPPEATLKECDQLMTLLGVGPGARLLDVPCGNGRHLLELAGRGFRMAGVDISPEFVDEVRTQLDSGWEADVHCGDMRSIPWDGPFDGAYCLGNSFGYVDRDGCSDFLSAVAKSLKPGARFVLETGMAAESILPNLVPRDDYETADCRMEIENRYRAQAGALETHYVFLKGGRREERVSLHHVFTIREIVGMLKHAGLQQKGLYSGLGGEPFEIGAPDLILLAVLPG